MSELTSNVGAPNKFAIFPINVGTTEAKTAESNPNKSDNPIRSL